MLVEYFQLTNDIHGLNDKNASRKNKIKPSCSAPAENK